MPLIKLIVRRLLDGWTCYWKSWTINFHRKSFSYETPFKYFEGWFRDATFSVKVYGPRLLIIRSTVQESSDYHFNQRHRILLLFMSYKLWLAVYESYTIRRWLIRSLGDFTGQEIGHRTGHFRISSISCLNLTIWPRLRREYQSYNFQMTHFIWLIYSSYSLTHRPPWNHIGPIENYIDHTR